VQDDGGTTNSGVDLDPSANTLTIVQNTAPTATDDALSATEKGGVNNATAGTDPTGNVITGTGGATADTDAETPGSLTVVSFGTGSSGGTPGVVDGTTQLTGDHGSLTLDSTGNFHYFVNQIDPAVQALVPASPALTDTFHYTIQDPGGLTSTAVITVSIHGANDLPGAVADAQTITEDAGAPIFSVLNNDFLDPDAGALNTVAPGSITVSSAAVGTSFANTDATAAAVNSGHDIQVTLGAAFQQLHAGETATVTVPYTLTGNGAETSTVNLVLTVNGANDVPVAVADDGGSISEDAADNTPFNVRGNDTLDADHGAANNITLDSVDVSGPAPDGLVAGDVTATPSGANVLISLGPNFDKLGGGETATVDVHYTLHGDQAGDTSSSTLHFVVNGVNDAPVAADFTFSGANAAIANTDLVVNDPADGAPDPAGPQKTISGSLLGGATDVDTAHSSLTITAGTVSNAAGSITFETDGDFTYHPTAGFTGNAVFNYTLNDNDASGNATDTGQVTIAVGTPKVWYVSQTTGNDTTGDGTSEHPFASLAPLSTGGSADSLDGANDLIFLYNGTYTGGIVLESGQQLIGQSQGLTVNGTTLETATAGNATINGTVTLADGNTIDGITFGNTSGFSLQDSGATVGTATVAHSSISNANGGAVSIANGGTLAMNFSSITASGTSTSAIALANTTGTFTGSGGTLNNGAATAADVSITGNHSGDDVNFTYDGAINDATGTTVAISGQNGGTKDFNGAITGGGIALTTDNTGATVNFDGALSLSTGAAAAFSASGGGTLNVTNAGNSITTTTGTALNLNGITVGAGNIAFNSVTTNGAATGISIDTVSGGTINVNGGSIAGATTRGVDINAAQNNITIASTIGSTAGHSVEVTNSGKVGGNTIAFTGAITDTGGGINLDNNDANTTGATINFSGGLAINTSASNSTGFSATNGGTVNVTQNNTSIVNTINSGQGTALNVDHTNIGASDLTFRSLASSGGSANGIILNTTGSAGGLHVVGTGSAGSGGTIATKTGADGSTTQGSGIYLNSTSDVQLDRMNLHDFQNFGIFGNSVSDFGLTNSTVNATASAAALNGTAQGSPSNEGSIRFTELTGTANITNDTIADGITTDMTVFNTVSGSALTLNVSGSTFTGNGTTTVQELLLTAGSNAGDSPTMTANITTSHFTNNDARGIQAVANGAATMNINIGQNGVNGSGGTFDGMPAAMIDLDHNSTGNYNFNVQKATFNVGGTGASVPINIFNGTASGSGSTFQGRVVQNSITGQNNSGFDGISMTGSGPGTMTVLVDNNTVTNIGANGIRYTGAQNSSTNHTNLTITNNTITMPSVDAGFGVQVSAQASSSASSVVEALISNNNVVNNPNIAYEIDARFATATLQMPGYVGGNSTSNAATFVAGNNKVDGNPATSADVFASLGLAPGGNFSNTPGGAAVPLPANPQPLFAASGGVQASSPTAGETHLTQAELDSVVAAAIGQWALAGASAAQLAALHATTFSVADLSGVTIGEETSGHITIDIDAAGHGWFIDPTPSDNSEFTHAANAAGTDLYTDPSNAAAGHLDLLTTVTHELGHVIGLPDTTASSTANDLMYINLVDGERRLADATDVAQANDTSVAQAVEASMPLSAQAVAGTPIVVGTSGNDTIDAGHGGNILFGGAGADNFVFGPSTPLNAPTPAQLTHVADYHAAEGDTFDFSAITLQFHNSGANDALVVRAVEDASGKFATLQVDHIDPAGLPSAPNWVNVAQLDGAHAGDAVNILIDNHSVHLAQIHVDLLV
jgi:VCBS repeat-containing protein